MLPYRLAHQAPLSMGILQKRILEWDVMPFSKGSSWHRDWICVSYVSCIGRQFLYHQCHLGSLLTQCPELRKRVIRWLFLVSSDKNNTNEWATCWCCCGRWWWWWWWWLSYQFAQAVITKKHRLRSSKQQRSTFHYCGGWKSKIKLLAGLASCSGPSPWLVDAHLVLLSSHSLFSVSVSKFPLPISTLVILDWGPP